MEGDVADQSVHGAEGRRPQPAAGDVGVMVRVVGGGLIHTSTVATAATGDRLRFTYLARPVRAG